MLVEDDYVKVSGMVLGNTITVTCVNVFFKSLVPYSWVTKGVRIGKNQSSVHAVPQSWHPIKRAGWFFGAQKLIMRAARQTKLAGKVCTN